MSGVNKVILMGRLGKDPEVSYTRDGLAVCRISIATSRKQQNGQEITSWHRCIAYGKAAEIIGQYVRKGHMLYVEGELVYGQYEKDGVTRYTTDIRVHEFEFTGKGGAA